MGGDHAPGAMLDGLALALSRGKIQPGQTILTGPEEVLRTEMRAHGIADDAAVVRDAPDVLTGAESPVDAMRKKPRNSIAVGIGLLREGAADAFVSAGSTGAVVAAATFGLKRLDGIRRPGIAVNIDGQQGPFTVIDVGANSQTKAEDLLSYAIMGSAYHRATFGTAQPRVGLLNIGSEEGKGSPLVRQAAELLRSAPVNFIGNVEGVDVFAGGSEVVVCDGFTGNVLLKVSEGVAEYMLSAVHRHMTEAGAQPELLHTVVERLKHKVDYSNSGGALLLGVDGIVTICHGRSQAPAIANALPFAVRAVGGQLTKLIVDLADETRRKETQSS
jgi:glycerol-3-phosphate acyltransferase PlsX